MIRRPPRSTLFPYTTLSVVAVSLDRKSTRLNSSHTLISYAVFCFNKAAQLDARRQMRADMGVVALLGRGVDDKEKLALLERVGGPRHHQVVEDAAALVEELGVALLPGLEVQDVGRDERLERLRGRRVIRPDQRRLAHVRDVEEPGVLARPEMLGEDAGLILHRHVVAGKRHHPRVERQVLGMERRLERWFAGGC